MGAASRPTGPASASEQVADQDSGAAGVGIDEAIGYPRCDEVRSAQLREITPRIPIAVSRRVVKRATVEFNDHPLRRVTHILVGEPASRGAASLTLTFGQPVRPLDPMQVAAFQYRSCAVAKIGEHCLQRASAANTLASRQCLQPPL